MWPFDETLDALNGIWEIITGFYEWLTWLAALFLYFPLSAFAAFYDAVVTEINLVISFVNALVDTFNFVTNDILGLFVNIWPNNLISYILVMELSVIALYRIYHFARDVEILGNKI